MRMAVKVTQAELVGLFIDYAGKRTVDSLIPCVGNWVEPFTEIGMQEVEQGLG